MRPTSSVNISINLGAIPTSEPDDDELSVEEFNETLSTIDWVQGRIGTAQLPNGVAVVDSDSIDRNAVKSVTDDVTDGDSDSIDHNTVESVTDDVTDGDSDSIDHNTVESMPEDHEAND